MKTSLICLAIAVFLSWLFYPGKAKGQDIDPADMALAAARLEATTEPATPCRYLYVYNTEFDEDAVEIAPEETVEALPQTRPLELPAGVPDDFVPVRAFQKRGTGELMTYEFLGWLLLPLKDVRALHAETETI